MHHDDAFIQTRVFLMRVSEFPSDGRCEPILLVNELLAYIAVLIDFTPTLSLI